MKAGMTRRRQRRMVLVVLWGALQALPWATHSEEQQRDLALSKFRNVMVDS